jgi:hypothetical protein
MVRRGTVPGAAFLIGVSFVDTSKREKEGDENEIISRHKISQ